MLPPGQATEMDAIRNVLLERHGIPPEEMGAIEILRRSLDARRGKVRWQYRVRVYAPDEGDMPLFQPVYRDVHRAEPVFIVGTGPAGLFCALRLLELGLKPVLFERGQDVHRRKRDVALISREFRVDPDSNYCFGEGGAGTFSDGKLYTRASKRGDVRKILRVLAWHGAPLEILYDAHPHIGTDRLPGVIERIRETITGFGGEIHFGSRLTEIRLHSGKLRGIGLNSPENHSAGVLVLATGHSAKDVYELLHRNNIRIEAKGFAMGVRVEHPQELINQIQYHGPDHPAGLPAAAYQLTARAGKRGVYSFCMCPGGFILPSATSAGEVVVNGMSPYRRNSAFANSGIVTEIREQDIPHTSRYGVLAGLKYQEGLEKDAWYQGGKTQQAPAQRLSDFMDSRHSATLPTCSYFPGVRSSSLHEWLPEDIRENLRAGFRQFDRQMKGFITREALIVGVESRTSSPLRIPRDPENYMSVSCEGLFPCGEGSGYAGGILSSAMDGENTADRVASFLRMV